MKFYEVIYHLQPAVENAKIVEQKIKRFFLIFYAKIYACNLFHFIITPIDFWLMFLVFLGFFLRIEYTTTKCVILL